LKNRVFPDVRSPIQLIPEVVRDGSPRVPHGHQDISEESGGPRSPNGAPGESPGEFLRGKRGQIHQGRLDVLLAIRQFRISSESIGTVEGAYLLADVASKDQASHGLAELMGYGSAVLYVEIGDTSAGIDPVGLDNGTGGTGIHAKRAGTAMVGRWPVRQELQGGQDHSDEEIRTPLRIDGAAVFPDPPDAGPFRPCPLQDGTGVDIVPESVGDDAFLKSPAEFF
jgi:hypothetical protein